MLRALSRSSMDKKMAGNMNLHFTAGFDVSGNFPWVSSEKPKLCHVHRNDDLDPLCSLDTRLTVLALSQS